MIKYSSSSVLTKIFQLIKSKFDNLSKVASTGSYKDLNNLPEVACGSVVISQDGQTVIDIPIQVSNVNNMLVYQNGILLAPTLNYTATTTRITLSDYSTSSGDIFTFIKVY